MAAIAIPNFIAMQLEARCSEVPANVDGIVTAELSYDAAYGTFLACGSEEQAVQAVGKEARDWSTDPAAECFAQLGWRPDGQTRGGYWVVVGTDETGAQTFDVYGVSDVDGEGNLAVYHRSPGAGPAELISDPNQD